MDFLSESFVAPDVEKAKLFMSSQYWPAGLQEQFITNALSVPMRYVIVDNSGSMNLDDGHRFVSESGVAKFIPVSRWTELTDSIRFQATLAEEARTPTEFRLLNGTAPPATVGRGDDGGSGFFTLLALLEDEPNHQTPLCFHITEIIRKIAAIAPRLMAMNQRAVLVIATDGEASDGDMAMAMAPLQTLPVWVVIRLCTSDEAVVRYWNEIDQQLEVEMDVLHDYASEAREIAKVNSWLTYGEPLHRLREFGITVREMDQMDESPLLPDQIRGLISSIIFGHVPPDMPPTDDAEEFMAYFQLMSQPSTWNPLTLKKTTWILIPELKSKLLEY
mmetsp:Transcript_16087/g.16218  ORF Transcript_16087/g.16218 Transcript_16087/m.16218 type:complete len:332 (-) Transcript_16087:286-1281(-)|eukprot:CAMPEP_0182428440 /NCGR_PEP_ID=MMETSP1167-20130531/23034_1 /TAXON_ID=2988 /ORGANISM="Mallomonas Sp, Strain CCMP3275" /LENGTH=331 /DNA_ID=CAMNT_0024611371 /DNA_START=125 /DNA_END=1120 /DNA_ORIENTATION=-